VRLICGRAQQLPTKQSEQSSVSDVVLSSGRGGSSGGVGLVERWRRQTGSSSPPPLPTKRIDGLGRLAGADAAFTWLAAAAASQNWRTDGFVDTGNSSGAAAFH
jgi:hypothetical protein